MSVLSVECPSTSISNELLSLIFIFVTFCFLSIVKLMQKSMQAILPKTVKGNFQIRQKNDKKYQIIGLFVLFCIS